MEGSMRTTTQSNRIVDWSKLQMRNITFENMLHNAGITTQEQLDSLHHGIDRYPLKTERTSTRYGLRRRDVIDAKYQAYYLRLVSCYYNKLELETNPGLRENTSLLCYLSEKKYKADFRAQFLTQLVKEKLAEKSLNVPAKPVRNKEINQALVSSNYAKKELLDDLYGQLKNYEEFADEALSAASQMEFIRNQIELYQQLYALHFDLCANTNPLPHKLKHSIPKLGTQFFAQILFWKNMLRTKALKYMQPLTDAEAKEYSTKTEAALHTAKHTLICVERTLARMEKKNEINEEGKKTLLQVIDDYLRFIAESLKSSDTQLTKMKESAMEMESGNRSPWNQLHILSSIKLWEHKNTILQNLLAETDVNALILKAKEGMTIFTPDTLTYELHAKMPQAINDCAKKQQKKIEDGQRMAVTILIAKALDGRSLTEVADLLKNKSKDLLMALLLSVRQQYECLHNEKLHSLHMVVIATLLPVIERELKENEATIAKSIHFLDTLEEINLPDESKDDFVWTGDCVAECGKQIARIAAMKKQQEEDQLKYKELTLEYKALSCIQSKPLPSDSKKSIHKLAK